MRWLLHGNLTPAVGDALRQRGDNVVDPTTVGLPPDSPHPEVLKSAHKAQLDVMTSDAKLAESPFAEGAPPFGRSIVYLQLEGGDVEPDDAVTRLFERYKRLTPGRLYTVTGTRVKIRQLPGSGRG
jgi:predicted nuclease of predicted toxin-antitoxin system